MSVKGSEGRRWLGNREDGRKAERRLLLLANPLDAVVPNFVGLLLGVGHRFSHARDRKSNAVEMNEFKLDAHFNHRAVGDRDCVTHVRNFTVDLGHRVHRAMHMLKSPGSVIRNPAKENKVPSDSTKSAAVPSKHSPDHLKHLVALIDKSLTLSRDDFVNDAEEDIKLFQLTQSGLAEKENLSSELGEHFDREGEALKRNGGGAGGEGRDVVLDPTGTVFLKDSDGKVIGSDDSAGNDKRGVKEVVRSSIPLCRVHDHSGKATENSTGVLDFISEVF